MQKESEATIWDNAVSESIVIKASRALVWSYGSDSSKAREWSVFFHHISPVPGKSDGDVGSVRRCFRMEDETGAYWDEVITRVVPEEIREITTYNLTGFDFNFLSNGQYVFVRQIYKALDSETTELTFQTTSPHTANPLAKFVFYLSKDKTRKIFKENLENIKAGIEGKPRLHKWY